MPKLEKLENIEKVDIFKQWFYEKWGSFAEHNNIPNGKIFVKPNHLHIILTNPKWISWYKSTVTRPNIYPLLDYFVDTLNHYRAPFTTLNLVWEIDGEIINNTM